MIKNVIKRVLKSSGIVPVPVDRFQELEKEALIGSKVGILKMASSSNFEQAINAIRNGRSQIGQDVFVLNELNWKENGFFVEFGATDGISLNNTWLLENSFAWRGILAEPAHVWRDALDNSGRQAKIDNNCVWSSTGKTLTFNEDEWPELSTIREFKGSDTHRRKKAGSYSVHTISLNDLLEKHDAPKLVDYLSIDTEGSEYEILSNFDFDKHVFSCITCEHNFTPNREKIYDLLTSKGYQRKFEDLSLMDDWYVYSGTNSS